MVAAAVTGHAHRQPAEVLWRHCECMLGLRLNLTLQQQGNRVVRDLAELHVNFKAELPSQHRQPLSWPHLAVAVSLNPAPVQRQPCAGGVGGHQLVANLH